MPDPEIPAAAARGEELYCEFTSSLAIDRRMYREDIWHHKLEDIHMNVEARLFDLIGAPVNFVGANWFNGRCVADPEVNNDDHLLGYTEGDYGIEIDYVYSMDGPIAHRSIVELQGMYSGLNGECTWTPNPDGTKDLQRYIWTYIRH